MQCLGFTESSNRQTISQLTPPEVKDTMDIMLGKQTWQKVETIGQFVAGCAACETVTVVHRKMKANFC